MVAGPGGVWVFWGGGTVHVRGFLHGVLSDGWLRLDESILVQIDINHHGHISWWVKGWNRLSRAHLIFMNTRDEPHLSSFDRAMTTDTKALMIDHEA